MSKLVWVLLLFFVITSHAQSPRIDSSLLATQTHLHFDRAKEMGRIRKCLADSGTYKRLDSLNYSYFIIQMSGRGRHFSIMELYYKDADSIPVLVCRNNFILDKAYCGGYASYSSQLQLSGNAPAVRKRKYKFIEHYYHGCLVPPRIRARSSLRERLNKYTVDVYYDKSSGQLKTQTVLPRHFHPFIMKMEGGLF